MATVQISKPQAGTQNVITNVADGNLALEFATGNATMSKEDNNLVFTFADGSSVVLQDFYTVYTKENMPTFEIGGETVKGEDFFAALNADLAPAAGPAAARQMANGGRYHDYANADLVDGLDRLGAATEPVFAAQGLAPVEGSRSYDAITTGTDAAYTVAAAGTLTQPTVPTQPVTPPHPSLNDVYLTADEKDAYRNPGHTVDLPLEPGVTVVACGVGQYGQIVQMPSGEWGYQLTKPYEHTQKTAITRDDWGAPIPGVLVSIPRWQKVWTRFLLRCVMPMG